MIVLIYYHQNRNCTTLHMTKSTHCDQNGLREFHIVLPNNSETDYLLPSLWMFHFLTASFIMNLG